MTPRPTPESTDWPLYGSESDATVRNDERPATWPSPSPGSHESDLGHRHGNLTEWLEAALWSTTHG